MSVSPSLTAIDNLFLRDRGFRLFFRRRISLTIFSRLNQTSRDEIKRVISLSYLVSLGFNPKTQGEANVYASRLICDGLNRQKALSLSDTLSHEWFEVPFWR